MRFTMRRPASAPIAIAGLGAAGLAVAALISGCVAVAAADEDGRRAAATSSASPAPSASPTPSASPAPSAGAADKGSVTAGKAEAIALRAVPGTVTDMELDDDDGRLRWEVDVRPRGGGADREVHVDATTGKVLATAADDKDDCDDGKGGGGKDDDGKHDDDGDDDDGEYDDGKDDDGDD